MADDLNRFMWMGRFVDELSREELIGIIAYLARDLARYRTPEMINAIAVGQVARLTGGRVPKSLA